MMAKISLNMSGQIQAVDVDPATSMLWVLQDYLKLIGIKYGCGIALCGYCQAGQEMTAALLKKIQLPVMKKSNRL